MPQLSRLFVLASVAGGIAFVAYLVARDSTNVGDVPPAPVSATTDPDAHVRVVPIMSELSANKPLRLAVGGKFDDLKPQTTTKLFFATQAVYAGPISTDGVEAMISHGRAHSLEHRLCATSLERLRGTLAEFDEALRDVSLLIEDEKALAIERLRQRDDRVIVIRTQPIESDPEYMRLRAAHAETARGRGCVWPVHDKLDRQTYVVVKWTEWPALKVMMDDQLYMIEDRERRVAQWIKSTYRAQGLAMFAPPSDAPGRGGSPAVRSNG